MPEDLIPLAKIGAAHGVKGEVRVKPYGEAEMLSGYASLQDASGRPFKVIHSRFQKGMLITKFEGIDDRNEAESLNGQELYIARSELPETAEGEFYISDLTGMQALDETGAVIGKVVSVPNFGAGDLIEIAPSSGGETFLLPFTKAIFPEINLESARLKVVLPAETSDRDNDE